MVRACWQELNLFPFLWENNLHIMQESPMVCFRLFNRIVSSEILTQHHLLAINKPSDSSLKFPFLKLLLCLEQKYFSSSKFLFPLFLNLYRRSEENLWRNKFHFKIVPKLSPRRFLFFLIHVDWWGTISGTTINLKYFKYTYNINILPGSDAHLMAYNGELFARN